MLGKTLIFFLEVKQSARVEAQYWFTVKQIGSRLALLLHLKSL
jgi:hypothetical protein